MLEHRQATDGRNPFCVRHSRSQLSGYAVLHFTYLRAPVVKVPRLVAPTGESKLSSTSHGHYLQKVLYQGLQPRSRALVRPLHSPPQSKGGVPTDGGHRVSILTGLEPVILKTKINN